MVRISLVTLLTFFLSVCFFVMYAHTETHANTHTQVRILLHIALIYQETQHLYRFLLTLVFHDKVVSAVSFTSDIMQSKFVHFRIKKCNNDHL